MIRQEFIDHLIGNSCVVVRTDNKGYSIIRNVISAKMTGLPVNDPVLAATVCRICKTLGVDIPVNDYVQGAVEIVEIAHKNHSKRED